MLQARVAAWCLRQHVPVFSGIPWPDTKSLFQILSWLEEFCEAVILLIL